MWLRKRFTLMGKQSKPTLKVTGLLLWSKKIRKFKERIPCGSSETTQDRDRRKRGRGKEQEQEEKKKNLSRAEDDLLHSLRRVNFLRESLRVHTSEQLSFSEFFERRNTQRMSQQVLFCYYYCWCFCYLFEVGEG